MVNNVRQASRLALHPSEGSIYAADTDSSPSTLRRLDLSPGGVIAARWASPEHGLHRINGNVWASPLGDVLITRGGDVFTSGATQSTDMVYLSGLSVGTITQLAWDVPHGAILTVEGSTVHLYDCRAIARSHLFADAAGSFLGSNDGKIYALVPTGDVTNVQVFTRDPAATSP
jgi:hypothetical protein